MLKPNEQNFRKKSFLKQCLWDLVKQNWWN